MESDMASVMMMVGAVKDIGVSPMRLNPAKPMAATMDKVITSGSTMLAASDRRLNASTTMMIRYISGMRVPISCWDASAKALLSMAMPEIAIVISGYFASN